MGGQLLAPSPSTWNVELLLSLEETKTVGPVPAVWQALARVANLMGRGGGKTNLERESRSTSTTKSSESDRDKVDIKNLKPKKAIPCSYQLF